MTMVDSEIRTTLKHTASIASIGIAPASMALLQKHLAKFNVSVHEHYLQAMAEIENGDQRWDAFAIKIDGAALDWMKIIRQSARNRHALVYAFGDEAGVARIGDFGVNSLIEDSTDSVISREVESTYLLLLRQLRRFVRIPLVVVVTLTANARSYTAVSRNLSAGGMNLSFPHELPAASKVEMSFSLPRSPIFSLPATVCRQSLGSLGVEFLNPADYHKIRNWIEHYLEVSQ